MMERSVCHLNIIGFKAAGAGIRRIRQVAAALTAQEAVSIFGRQGTLLIVD